MNQSDKEAFSGFFPSQIELGQYFLYYFHFCITLQCTHKSSKIVFKWRKKKMFTVRSTCFTTIDGRQAVVYTGSPDLLCFLNLALTYRYMQVEFGLKWGFKLWDVEIFDLQTVLQVNLCQHLLFLHQLTHNMTTDCSSIYLFNTWKIQAQNMGRTCYAHKLFFVFVLTSRTIYAHNRFSACSFHVLNW